jgi:tetratricopeptide (TPR) repeat protein
MWLRAGVLIAVLLGGIAVADKVKDRDRADVLFKQGKRLMTEQRYADACAAFEESFQLDPAIGTELNTARCYEQWGKLARAYRAYVHAEDMAKQANDARTAKIHELVAGIEKDVPRLTIQLPQGAPSTDVRVTLDGTPLGATDLGKPQLVDPGPHMIEYQTGNEPKRNQVVPLERGGDSKVTLESTNVGNPDDDGAAHSLSDPGRKRRLVGYGVAGAGGVLVGVSAYLALSARSQYNDALASHCMHKASTCDQQGLAATHDARHEANIATVVFLLGTAAIGGGVALYVTAPHTPARGEHALRVTPVAHPGGGELVLGGVF